SGSVISPKSVNVRRHDHRHQFVGAFLDDDIAFSELVAAAYHCSLVEKMLGYGSSFGLGERSPLRSRGYAGAVVLEPNFFPMFSDGERPELSVPTTLFSVVPVTGDELNVKLSKGLDALLDAWSEAGKEVFRVNPRTGTQQ
ncbi:MAG TPA: hypothetical protein VMK42_12375, partial [Anaeromyxobacteraceae bacterium]|nr:hypothetical protein [Anaeromyxobacteraceae bacterium]